MGRLFWKFFLLAAVAQFVTVIGVGISVWLRHEAQMPSIAYQSPMLERRLDEAVAAFERGGVEELRSRLEAGRREPGPHVIAVDAHANELLGRRVEHFAEPDSEPKSGAAPRDRSQQSMQPQSPLLEVRHVGTGDSALTVFLEPGDRDGGLRGPPAIGLRFPVEPIIGGVIASLVLATLLALYVAKPIRHLRRAFDAVADGNLDVRVGNAIGGRRDELADLGRDFDRTVERLRALVEGQRRLLHTVSHELRSPLARMQAAVGLARQSKDVEPSMERIELEAERMDRLVDELLTLSRAQSVVIAEKTDNVDLADLVTGVIDDAMFEIEASGRPVGIERGFTSIAGVVVRGNPELLHRAIENVLRNAVRHAREPGTVRVSGTFDHGGREAAIVIADDGPGVSADDLPSIFEPFFRGEGARQGQGHGLGLAITRGVVEAHGGRVQARNSASDGLMVEIHLPIARDVTKIYTGEARINGA